MHVCELFKTQLLRPGVLSTCPARREKFGHRKAPPTRQKAAPLRYVFNEITELRGVGENQMSDLIYRPGLEGVIAGETAISTIEGGLRYRGYAIEDLAANTSFDEVAFLVLHGELPTDEQLKTFRSRLAAAAQVDDAIIATLRSIPAEVPMMDVMRTGASMLAHWDPQVADNSHDANLAKAERMLAQLPVIMAARHRITNGKEPVAADPALSFSANVLYLSLIHI